MGNSANKLYERDTQYATSKNLDARYALHQRYTPRGKNIWDFIWDRYCFEPDSKILEVGCGFGAMWTHRACKLPKNTQLTLTDLSDGMLQSAREQLAHLTPQIHYEQADVEDLEYDSNSFDVVLAHYMLYHTHSKERALEELKRVVKPHGYVGVILNGKKHMQEMKYLAAEAAPEVRIRRADSDVFSAEVAEPLLNQKFCSVEKADYHYEMRVDDPSLLVAYARSSESHREANLPDDFWNRYAETLQEKINVQSYIPISKHSVHFILRKERPV